MNRRHWLTSLPTLMVAAGMSGSSSARAAVHRGLRVGVIGHTGRGDYGHGLDTMWLEIPEVKVVAVADPHQPTLSNQVKKLKADTGFDDYRRMLDEARPDIVAIGPRHIDQHRDMLMAAIAAGVRGIYIEKPFVRSPAEADQVLMASASSGTKIAVAHRNRYHPVLPVVAKLLSEGAIGQVLEMRGRGKEDPRGGGLDLWVLGTHVMNLADYFAGPPVACSALVSQDGRPVTQADVSDGAEGIGPLAGNRVHARFCMQEGLPFYFDSIQNARTRTPSQDHPASFGLQIIGTQGIIDFRIDQPQLATILPGSPWDPDLNQPLRWLPISSGGIDQPEPVEDLPRRLSNHLLAGQDLVAAITEDRQPLCDARQAAQTIEMVSAVFESHRLGGQRVSLPLDTRVNPLTLL